MLDHASIQITERYLLTKQNLIYAPNNRMGLRWREWSMHELPENYRITMDVAGPDEVIERITDRTTGQQLLENRYFGEEARHRVHRVQSLMDSVQAVLEERRAHGKKLTPARRKEIARKAAVARWDKNPENYRTTIDVAGPDELIFRIIDRTTGQQLLEDRGFGEKAGRLTQSLRFLMGVVQDCATDHPV